MLVEAGILNFEETSALGTTTDPDGTRSVGTPEIYLGASRIANFGSFVEGIEVDVPHVFPKPTNIAANTFYLEGNWKITPEFSEFLGDKGSITIRYQARNVHLVLEAGEEVIVEVMLDGKYLTEDNKGEDVFIENGKSFMRVKDATIYNIIRDKGAAGEHTLELFPTSSGLKAFAFTFG